MPSSSSAAVDQWVTCASCDVGERALACWIGRVNLANPLEFETLDWWVIDVYPSYWTKNSRKTPMQQANRFFHDHVKQRFQVPWIINEVECVIIESQFRPNKRMYALSHAFNTNIWYILPNARTDFVSSANKTKFIKKHAPELMLSEKTYKSLSADQQKKERKRSSVAFARRVEPLIDDIRFRKKDDLADTLNQALGSTAKLKMMMRKPPPTCTIPPIVPRQRKWFLVNAAASRDVDGRDRRSTTRDGGCSGEDEDGQPSVLVVDDVGELQPSRPKKRKPRKKPAVAVAAAASDVLLMPDAGAADDAAEPQRKRPAVQLQPTVAALPAVAE